MGRLLDADVVEEQSEEARHIETINDIENLKIQVERYDKGYIDGLYQAINDFAEKLKEYINLSMLPRVTELETGHALMELMDFGIDEVKKQLKNDSVNA